MPRNNYVQSIGDFTATFRHTNVAGGAVQSLTGFKVEGTLLDAVPLMDNSKIVALVNGDTVTLTNTVRAGTLTWNCVPTSMDPLRGDIVGISLALQEVGDSEGGDLRVTFGLAGGTFSITFKSVTVKKAPPLRLMGNDVAEYTVEWNYADFVIGAASVALV